MTSADEVLTYMVSDEFAVRCSEARKAQDAGLDMSVADLAERVGLPMWCVEGAMAALLAVKSGKPVTIFPPETPTQGNA